MPSGYLQNNDGLLVSIMQFRCLHCISYSMELFSFLSSHCRHPEKSERPTFSGIFEALSQPSVALLKWSVEDRRSHQQATVLGAEVVAGNDLHFDIQETYIKRQS